MTTTLLKSDKRNMTAMTCGVTQAKRRVMTSSSIVMHRKFYTESQLISS